MYATLNKVCYAEEIVLLGFSILSILFFTPKYQLSFVLSLFQSLMIDETEKE